MASQGSLRSSRSRSALAVSLLLLGTACATRAPPPTDQMTVARAAVDAANAAGSQGSAPNELRMANAKLALAQQAMAEKDYGVALRLAQQAQADAQLATSKAQATRAHAAADQALSAARTPARPADPAAATTGTGSTR